MLKRSSTKRQDVTETAFAVVQSITTESQQTLLDAPEAMNGKNPAAVSLGRLGGLKGGQARAAKLSAKKRTEIAKKAARIRWQKSSK